MPSVPSMSFWELLAGNAPFPPCAEAQMPQLLPGKHSRAGSSLLWPWPPLRQLPRPAAGQLPAAGPPAAASAAPAASSPAPWPRECS